MRQNAYANDVSIYASSGILLGARPGLDNRGVVVLDSGGFTLGVFARACISCGWFRSLSVVDGERAGSGKAS